MSCTAFSAGNAGAILSRIEAAHQAARLQHAQAKAEKVPQLGDQTLAGDAAGGDAMHVDLRQPVAETLAALVGRQGDAQAPHQQDARQGLRREHMAAGAAGRQQDEGCRRGHHESRLPGNRLRVSARSMPTPSAMATIEEPP